MVFANKYQMECRSRELGLYLLLGMKKKRLFYQIMAESIISSLIALCGGIVIGGFLSEIISLTMARLVGHAVITNQVYPFGAFSGLSLDFCQFKLLRLLL